MPRTIVLSDGAKAKLTIQFDRKPKRGRRHTYATLEVRGAGPDEASFALKAKTGCDRRVFTRAEGRRQVALDLLAEMRHLSVEELLPPLSLREVPVRPAPGEFGFVYKFTREDRAKVFYACCPDLAEGAKDRADITRTLGHGRTLDRLRRADDLLEAVRLYLDGVYTILSRHDKSGAATVRGYVQAIDRYFESDGRQEQTLDWERVVCETCSRQSQIIKPLEPPNPDDLGAYLADGEKPEVRPAGEVTDQPFEAPSELLAVCGGEVYRVRRTGEGRVEHRGESPVTSVANKAAVERIARAERLERDRQDQVDAVTEKLLKLGVGEVWPHEDIRDTVKGIFAPYLIVDAAIENLKQAGLYFEHHREEGQRRLLGVRRIAGNEAANTAEA